MKTLEQVEKELFEAHKEIALMLSSYNPASNKAHIVEKQMGKLTDKIMDLMCEKHLLIEEWQEMEISEDSGEVMSIAEFGRRFADGDLMDDDGVAFYVTYKHLQTDIQVFPTWIVSNNKRPEFNHIIWYYADEIEDLENEYNVDGFEDIEEEF